ncbi:MAG: tRNA (adenosine(37)-N6)-threonylcarbamoyltransferase complex transferase subunit TsaD [Pseudomonadota bacterium]
MHEVAASNKGQSAPFPAVVLGVETSCDDTAAAVVRREPDGACVILANEVWEQHDAHEPYGGVVPEIAARVHVERVDVVIKKAMETARKNHGVWYDGLDAVAATAGPGLIGGVMVGLTAAKAVAITHDKPLVPVNHLEGHALSVRLTEKAQFPYLLLLISGGHTQLIRVDGIGRYERLGTTIDDAAGEAFDKTAKLLGLGQPGGPRIESAAVGGRASRYDFPRPLLKRPGCDFSLSGLKTAVRLAADALEEPTGQDIADIAAAFQAALSDHLAARTERAMSAFSSVVNRDGEGGGRRLVVAGGVAANCTVKSALSALCQKHGWAMIVPPAKYCTDNGAMIAWAGAERFAAGLAPPRAAALAMAPRARWPLAAPPEGGEFGGGRKGPKA